MKSGLFVRVAYRCAQAMRCAVLAELAADGSEARARQMKRMRLHANAILRIGMPGEKKTVVRGRKVAGARKPEA